MPAYRKTDSVRVDEFEVEMENYRETAINSGHMTYQIDLLK